VKYHSPARLDDTLVVTAELQEAGRVSLTIAQRAYLRTPGQTDRLLAEGTIRLGWVDSQTLKPGRIPAPVLEALK
jgi:acyl-CoA thioester hydrolase